MHVLLLVFVHTPFERVQSDHVPHDERPELNVGNYVEDFSPQLTYGPDGLTYMIWARWYRSYRP